MSGFMGIVAIGNIGTANLDRYRCLILRGVDMKEILADTARGQTLSPEAQKINELVREVNVLRECMGWILEANQLGNTRQHLALHLGRLLEKKP